MFQLPRDIKDSSPPIILSKRVGSYWNYTFRSTEIFFYPNSKLCLASGFTELIFCWEIFPDQSIFPALTPKRYKRLLTPYHHIKKESWFVLYGIVYTVKVTHSVLKKCFFPNVKLCFASGFKELISCWEIFPDQSISIEIWNVVKKKKPTTNGMKHNQNKNRTENSHL